MAPCEFLGNTWPQLWQAQMISPFSPSIDWREHIQEVWLGICTRDSKKYGRLLKCSISHQDFFSFSQHMILDASPQTHAVWEPDSHMGTISEPHGKRPTHHELSMSGRFPRGDSISFYMAAARILKGTATRLGFAGSFSTVLLRCLTGNWSFLMALTVVPWGNQTWFAGKCTIYQWFSWLETSIQVGDFALPCLITRGYLC